MNPIHMDRVQAAIIEIRGQKVLLDHEVARIYGVQTKRINEAVRNNPDKFPTAFPEKRLYMLATILKSPQATESTFSIIETFAKIRELSRTITALSVTKNEADQKPLLQRSGELVSGLFDDQLQNSGTETSIELNFAVLKFKHTIKRARKTPGA